ncbi:MAG: hypothetical protein MMC23_008855 [Stictis urceolatum]|nr:hypothetical protein [Stictis urceolata]
MRKMFAGRAFELTADGMRFGKSECSWLFLRDSCTCARCVDPSTSQKLFGFAEIPYNIQQSHIRHLSKGEVEVTWLNDIPGYENHQSVFSATFFDQNTSTKDQLAARNSFLYPQPWNREAIESVGSRMDLNFEDFMQSGQWLAEAVWRLQKSGLVFIHDVPIRPESVKNVAERLGPIRNTFYGETWDVRSVPSAKNVAYTSDHLGFHQDLLYMANPPGLQLLHVMKSSTVGGHSLFADAYNAIKQLQAKRTKHIRALLTVPVTYHYRNDGQWYDYTRPTLETGALDVLRGPNSFRRLQDLEYMRDYEYINYSPPFQAPFMMQGVGDLQNSMSKTLQDSQKFSRTSIKSYHEAIRALKGELEADENVYETRMESGTCVVFNNRRIVHARTAFSSTEGERWLRGAYVDMDCLMSRWRTVGATIRQDPSTNMLLEDEL